MRGIHKIFTRAATAGALSTVLATGLATGLAFAPDAQAQNTWSLPYPAASSTPHAQGPVDAQNPVARPTVVAPSPSPVPTITPPAPSPAATQAPRERPSATPRPATAPSAQPRATPTVTPTRASEPRAPEAPASAASSQPAPVATTPAPTLTPAPAPSDVADAEPAPQAQESWPFWWWAVPLALLVATGIFALLRRRDPAVEVTEWPEAAEPDAPAIVPAKPELQPAPARPVTPESVATPAPAAPIEISFEPVALRLSLVYATLQYRLTLTATASFPAAQLLGDMIGAHGSIPVEQQLAPAPEALTRLKALAPLAAGETATVTGELQLPLGAIVPVRQGSASLFVPLVRLCLLPDGGAPGERRVFTVGTVGGPALAPLRLDTGPNEHRDLAAREVEAARAYPVPSPVAG